ncbi:putative ATP-dependent RNA helicase DHR1 [Xanthoria parietina]
MAKFVPRDRKKRRRKADNTQDGGILDTNVVEVIPPVASEREKKKREIKNSIRAQQPAMSGKKAKRLDKYIDTKLRKEDTLGLIKQLEVKDVDASRLKRHGPSKFPMFGQTSQQKGRRRLEDGRKPGTYEGSSSEDSDVSESSQNDDADLRRDEVKPQFIVPSRPVVGSGLKRPLEAADGNPVIPKRQRLHQLPPKRYEEDELPWEGFGSDSDSSVSTRLESSESRSQSTQTDSDGESTYSETSSSTAHQRDDKRAGVEAMNAKRKQRSSAFKAWATERVNEALGFTPSAISDLPQNNPMDNQKYAIKPREPEQDPLPPELQPINNVPDRKAFSVTVNRSDDMQNSRLELPIVAEEQKIMEAIYHNATVVIWGATGSGKTTQVPQFLFEAGFGNPESPNPGMIGITQPRRVAAVSMAKRVGDELGNATNKVSYQIRFESSVSDKTAIKFMTDGILIREIANDFALLKYSVIVIDEAHERSTNTDILIGMVSRIVDLRASMHRDDPKIKPLKLVIMSATLRISDFLQNPNLFRNGPPPLLQAEGRQYPVTEHFARRTQRDFLEETFRKVSKGHKKLPPGGMLVFLTGQGEITSLAKRLREAFIQSSGSRDQGGKVRIGANEAPQETEDLEIGDYDYAGDRIQDDNSDSEDMEDDDQDFVIEDSTAAALQMHVLPLYSQLQTKDQLRVFEPPPEGSRLVVLATNVAETSLTIPGIRYVFDCGRAKEKKYDQLTGVQSFEVGWISKASASQRAGRAGRTGPGHCYRLYSSAVYERDFKEHAEPEILRMPVEDVVLQLKSMDLQHVVNFPFPTPPDRSSLAKAEKLLTYLGALSNGKITPVGRDLSIYPLSPRFSKMLLIGHQHGCMPYTIAMVAALAVPELFIPENQLDLSTPAQDSQSIYTHTDLQAEEAREARRKSYNHAHHLFSKNSTTSDGLKALTALCAYAYAPDPIVFCNQMFLRPKALSEASRLRSQLSSVVRTNHPTLLGSYNPRLPEPSKIQLKALQQILAAAFIDQLAIRADLAPSPPEMARKPSRAIDQPYLPLFPTHQGRVEDLVDVAVFIHPSSVLAHLPPKDLPQYLVYAHLQRGSPATIDGSKKVKTRMHALTSVTGNQIQALAQGTPLLGYGKPVGKIMEVEMGVRECWVGVEVRGEKGREGWPLGARRVVQRRKGGEWVVERVVD